MQVEHSNDTYDAVAAPWQPTRAVTCSAQHSFVLQQPQNVPGIETNMSCHSDKTVFAFRGQYSGKHLYHTKSRSLDF